MTLTLKKRTFDRHCRNDAKSSPLLILAIFGSDDFDLDARLTDVVFLTSGAIVVVVVAAFTFVFVDTG